MCVYLWTCHTDFSSYEYDLIRTRFTEKIRSDTVSRPHPFAVTISKVSETILTAEKI